VVDNTAAIITAAKGKSDLLKVSSLKGWFEM